MKKQSTKSPTNVVTSRAGKKRTDSEGIYHERLKVQQDTINRLFDRLYAGSKNTKADRQKLFDAMEQLYLARPAALKKLDIERASKPQWIMSQEWVATMLYVDRYCGDLKGLYGKLDYLQELGINYIHLMPILKMPAGENDGGYAVSDFGKVDPRFGSMSNIRGLTRKFRSKNMLLELDLVLNHTSDEHEWAKRALAGEKEFQEMYYFYDDRKIPDAFEETLEEVFPETAPGNFTYVEKLDKWVFTSFNNYQWDLNYTNPNVFIEMLKALLNLANQGVDVFRMDAVAFMWKRLGTRSQNLDEAHLLLQLFKACTKVVAPGVVFKAEAIVQPKEIVKYLGQGGVEECEIAYNASFMVYLWDSMATQNKYVLESGLKNMPRLPEGTTWINYIRCHDDIGLGYADEDIQNVGLSPTEHRKFIISFNVGEFEGSDARGQRFMHNPITGDARISGATASLLGLERGLEEDIPDLVEAAVNKILVMHSLIMSLGGIPLVYYGDELAYTNDYSYLDDPNKRKDNRWLNRPIIDWAKAERRTQKGTIEHRVFSAIQTMIAIRKSLPEFNNRNDYQLVDNDNPHIFAFLRESGGDKTLVVANVSPYAVGFPEIAAQQVAMGGELEDLFSGQRVVPSEGYYAMQPYQFYWLKQT